MPSQPEGASDKVLAIHSSDTAMSRPPRMTDHEVDEWIDEWRDWIVDASNEIEALRAKVEELEAAANHDDLHCIRERARQDARIRELETDLEWEAAVNKAYGEAHMRQAERIIELEAEVERLRVIVRKAMNDEPFVVTGDDS